MKLRSAYIAADFGGGSGRVMAGIPDHDGHIELIEVHRFTNRQVQLGAHLYWDLPALFAEMIEGLRKAASQYRILSVGIDTWGVDFGLLDIEGNLLSLPVCYRDEKSVAGACERYYAAHSSEAQYACAGIQQMDINSVYRLSDVVRKQPHIIEAAGTILFMPDLLSYFLTGVANVEYTIATTSELIDARTRQWNFKLIDSLAIPRRLFPEIVMPGSIRGSLTDKVKKMVEIDYDVPIVAVASHDTASAAAICPSFDNDSSAFLSSGTWSLLGVTVNAPILTEEARINGFTNEGATDGNITFLQNITGLWILQNLAAQWQHQGLTADYDTLVKEAGQSMYNNTIDVDNPQFAQAGIDMEDTIRRALAAESYPEPKSRGDIVKCVLLSLAKRYAKAIDGLNAILPRPIARLHVIGGGSKNRLLNQLTESAIGIPVIPGPAEATALGNISVQKQALNP